MYIKWLTKRKTEKSEEYKSQNKEVRKRINEAKNQYQEQKCNQIESKIGGARPTEVWKSIRTMKTKRKH